MKKHLNNFSKYLAFSQSKYCAECAGLILNYTCNCKDGPKVMQLPMPREWEEYFWMDGSVKPNLINYENFKR